MGLKFSPRKIGRLIMKNISLEKHLLTFFMVISPLPPASLVSCWPLLYHTETHSYSKSKKKKKKSWKPNIAA